MARVVLGSVVAIVVLLAAADVHSQQESQEHEREAFGQSSIGELDRDPDAEPEARATDETVDFGPLPAPIEWEEASSQEVSEYLEVMTEIKAVESVISMCDLHPQLPACADD